MVRLNTYRPGGRRRQAHEALLCAGSYYSVTMVSGAPQVEELAPPAPDVAQMANRLGLIVPVVTGEIVDIEGVDAEYQVTSVSPLILAPSRRTVDRDSINPVCQDACRETKRSPGDDL